MASLNDRIRALLWPAEMPASLVRGRLLVVGRYLYALLRALAEGELSLRAMGLVYTTILAIVPLLAFSFSLLKGLGIHRQLDPLLRQFLAPLGPQGNELTDNVVGFVDNVSGSTLASVSILFLLYTALSMAQKVESSFNYVWRVDRPRSLARRFSEYLSVMLVGPLVMSVAMGLIATVSSTSIMNRLANMQPIGSWIAGLGELTPYLLVIVAFSFLYVFVPNSKVQLRAALGGGLMAGLVWASSGSLFASFVVNASRTSAIYSGFAIVIVAMIWLYLSWLILLLGAQFAYYLQYPDDLLYGQRHRSMSNRLSERLALSTMLLVGRDFDAPGHGWRTGSVAAHLRVPRHQLEPIVSALTNAKILTSTSEQRLIPAKDPHRITLLEILNVVRQPSDDADQHGRWDAAVESFTGKIEAAIQGAAKNKTLADLVDEEKHNAEQPATAA